MHSAETSSPLEARPLRLPGGSLDENIQDLFDRAVPHFFLVAIIIGYVIVEWLHYFYDLPPMPVSSAITGLLVASWSLYRIYVHVRHIGRLRLARDGEVVVGQYLDQVMIDRETRIFHDLLAEGFNVDHVILSPRGVFVLDTRTYRKPPKGAAHVHIRYGRVYANGVEIESNPLEQARALSRWVQDLLEEGTGRRYTVQPVVLFPDWFVDPVQEMTDVWVLNPKALPRFIANCKVTLTEPELRLAAYQLSRYIRTR